MRPYKASEVSPFDGSSWHGLYYRDGHWHEVKHSASGHGVVFPSAAAAIVQARKLTDEETHPGFPQLNPKRVQKAVRRVIDGMGEA